LANLLFYQDRQNDHMVQSIGIAAAIVEERNLLMVLISDEVLPDRVDAIHLYQHMQELKIYLEDISENL
jgi:hypothetical protein